MHRTDILNELLKRGVHVGNDQDSRKQLASLSSIMSSDPRFRASGWTIRMLEAGHFN